MNTPTTTAERQQQWVELVPAPPRKARGVRLRRREPKPTQTDPAYGCVDWFEYGDSSAADASEHKEGADKRPGRH